MEEFHMPLKENFQELVQHGKSDFPIQYYVNSLHIAGNSVRCTGTRTLNSSWSTAEGCISRRETRISHLNPVRGYF